MCGHTTTLDPADTLRLLRATRWARIAFAVGGTPFVVPETGSRSILTALIHHWCHVTLYVTSSGWTTSLMPDGDRDFQIDFDFIEDRLDILVADGTRRSIVLAPTTTAEFDRELMGHARRARPRDGDRAGACENSGLSRFEDDDVHSSYDADQAHRFWVASCRWTVLTLFRSRFLGKCSPVHLFWGGLDLAVRRFSGRTAPPHPGGAPNCDAHVMLEAYSHEVSSAGYWPGPGGDGIFFCYAYPAPPGFRDTELGVPDATTTISSASSSSRIPRCARPTTPTPCWCKFLQASYEAAADHAARDRATLERPATARRAR